MSLLGCAVPIGTPADSRRQPVGNYLERQKLLASDKADSDQFGYMVAISADGHTALIGAIRKDVGSATDQGVAYVFVRTVTGGWTEQQKIQASDGATDANFGYSVALSADGNTALIGAAHQSEGALASNGAAYVFTRSGTTWTEQQKLLASDRADRAELGSAVALSTDGNTALVGAPLQSEAPNNQNGAAYVFTRSGTTWTEQQKLLASDRADRADLGLAVALSTDGSTALVGAPGQSEAPNSQNGAAYVFTRSGTTWTEQQKLLASDRASLDNFGSGLALSADGNLALIGATLTDDGAIGNCGAAYVFARSNASWSQGQKLVASDRKGSDYFGWPVALSGDGNTALIGASTNDDGSLENGAAYVFIHSGAIWSQQQKLLASDKGNYDWFGRVALSADGRTGLVGAPQNSAGATTGNGAVYAFALTQSNGVACTDGAECNSGFCTDHVCCESTCGGNDVMDCQACSSAAGGIRDGICSLLSQGTICRAGASLNDPAEVCSGTAPACPADVPAPEPGGGDMVSGCTCSMAAGAAPAPWFLMLFVFCSAALARRSLRHLL